MQFRKAKTADIDALVTLVNSAYRGETGKKGWTTETDLLDGQRTDRADLSDLLKRNDSVILVFESNKELVACVHLERRKERAYLGMLTVNPTLQAAGIGRFVLNIAERWVQGVWGVTKMEMQVIRQRPELLAWYERHGYRRTGETKPFPYHDERFGIPKRDDLEFVVLEKTLAQ
jgi:GNAT superfamily N-acetyltransferase